MCSSVNCLIVFTSTMKAKMHEASTEVATDHFFHANFKNDFRWLCFYKSLSEQALTF